MGAVALAAAMLAVLLGPLSAAAPTAPCTRSCGNISVPYPFGVEPGCFIATGFNLTCRGTGADRRGLPELFLGDGTVQVLDISVPNGTVRISGSPATFTFETWSNGVCHQPGFRGPQHSSNPHITPPAGPGAPPCRRHPAPDPVINGTWNGALGEGGPYTLAWNSRNILRAIGCNVQVLLEESVEANDAVSACTAFCRSPGEPLISDNVAIVDCSSGSMCCQANIIGLRSSYQFRAFKMDEANYSSTDAVAWIVDSEFSFDHIENYSSDGWDWGSRTLPAVLDSRIISTMCHGNASSAACRSSHSFCANDTLGRDGHLCYCDQGYQGNPYISHGCHDVNECESPQKYPCYGKCSNTEGSFQCQCHDGYSGNASIPNGCQDECENTTSHSCYGICHNFPGAFHCQCPNGTYGNPFTKGGCTIIKNSITGLAIGLGVGIGTSILVVALGAPIITRKIKLQKMKKMRQKYFNQNHGLLLQQLTSQHADFGERMIITLRELEKATNNFDRARMIGGGGHGVVFKGILDLHVVAIKKSKIVVQREIDEFINEVAILSQVNHRNVVKLIGCCFETEVPLLVYEFISNETLYQHLHIEGPESLSWVDRIRIALEVARALSYLHSAASVPIFHRDIKSSNILLDDSLVAKVSDFGASRYIPIDQMELTTAVQGTLGYLDPMYYYTGRLTEKSDVFSFGVLLIELLTRKKPFVYKSIDGDSLVSHFEKLLATSNLAGIIDPQVIEEEDGDVQEVATLAINCTKLRGEDRPTMREAEMTLENLFVKKKIAQYIAIPRRNEDETPVDHISTQHVVDSTSRQYTMEEEILLSASYPR